MEFWFAPFLIARLPFLSLEDDMSQRESRLSRDIQKELRRNGAWCIKIHGSEYMPAGVPDIVGCYQGRFFAFETKLPEKRSNTSVVQERMMEKIRAAGGKAQVVCTVSEAVDAMMNTKRDSRRPGIKLDSHQAVEDARRMNRSKS